MSLDRADLRPEVAEHQPRKEPAMKPIPWLVLLALLAGCGGGGGDGGGETTGGDTTPGGGGSGTFIPPYTLPADGQSVVIGTNSVGSVRPSTHSEFAWHYAVFHAYGGGAYVIAGTGGHAAPPNFGGVLFDFADATWRRVDNANGMPWMVRDLNEPPNSGEIDAFGEIAYPGVSSGMPAPSHVYGSVVNAGAKSGHETGPHGRPCRSKIRPVLVLSEERLR